jgi:hypothetical protein
MIDRFRNLPVEIVQDFRKTGKSQGIPAEIQEYISQVDRAVEIYRFEGNISRAAKKLQEQFPDISHATARNRIYDSLNLFHLNNTVKNCSWDQYYADKMEDLAKLAIADDNITEARRCFERAHSLRTNKDENAYDPEKLKPVEQIISPDVSHSRLNITQHNLNEIWKKTQEFILDLKDVDSKEKERLLAEAASNLGQPIDVDYEDVPD